MFYIVYTVCVSKGRKAIHSMNTHHGPQLSEPDKNKDVPVPSLDIVRAARLKLSRHMTVTQGLHVIVENCILQILGNEAGVAYGQDPESVHQMRVGLRRLRSVHRLFRHIVTPSATLQREIDWLSLQLSAVRDWEVLASSTLPAVEADTPPDMALPSLRAAVTAKAQAKRKRASAIIRSARFARLGAALSAWTAALEKQASSSSDDGESHISIKDFADRAMAHERTRLLKRGSRIDDPDPELRHQLRIAAKKARYATEFFSSLYPAKRVKAYAEPLLDLQDCLGAMNDFAVADRLLLELQKSKPALQAGANYVRGYLASNTMQQDRKLRKLWHRFELAPLPAG